MTGGVAWSCVFSSAPTKDIKTCRMNFKSDGTSCSAGYVPRDGRHDDNGAPIVEPTTASSVLTIECKSYSDLSDEELARWQSFHQSQPELGSPYYHPEFTAAVDEVRPDVEVAVIRNDRDQVVAFFPFQRQGKVAFPIGGRMNDFHGLVAHSGTKLNIADVFTSLGLKSFKFHAVVDLADNFKRHSFRTLKSHYIDMSDGFDHYHAWARKHSTTIKRQPQKTRALEREVGPLSFEFDCDDREILEQSIELKSAKYQRTKTFDILSVDWASNVLRSIFERTSEAFSGQLSVVRAGDELVAMHFGMINDDILHYWFPVFDPRFSKYSPGTILMLKSCEAAAARGITRVDLTFGDDPYKFKFANASSDVLAGYLTFNPIQQFLERSRYETRLLLKKIPFKPQAKTLLRKVYPGFGGWNFQ